MNQQDYRHMTNSFVRFGFTFSYCCQAFLQQEAGGRPGTKAKHTLFIAESNDYAMNKVCLALFQAFLQLAALPCFPLLTVQIASSLKLAR